MPEETPGAPDLPGYDFRDPRLLTTALTHPSAGPDHNQRLEFLGDAVVGLAVAELLLEEAHDQTREGPLTRARAAVVSREGLAQAARELDLGRSLVLGASEVQSGGAGKPRILCGAFEAVVGAVFLDGGWEAARGFCRRTLGPAARQAATAAEKDPKNLLQEVAQARGTGLPSYQLVGEEGEPHRPLFRVRVQVGWIRATGSGGTKKDAERDAARRALETLERHPDILPGPPLDEAP